MKIAVLGTGMVGRTLAGKLAQLGHAVTIGTRDVAALMERTEPDAMGNPPFRIWQVQNQNVQVGGFASVVAYGEVIFNCTNGAVSLDVLKQAGEAHLNGKVLVDIANPLDFSKGMLPSLFVFNTDSLGEQLQRAFPNVKVVKTLNTMNAYLMVAPKQLGGGDHTVFMSGNDAGAKAQVAEFLRSFGWQDIIDLGDISTARGTEMLLPIWLRLWGALQTSMINFKIVR